MATVKKAAATKPAAAPGKPGPKKSTPAQLANLKSWAPGQSGNPDGRPAKIYTVIKKMGYGTTDIKTAFLELGFYTQAELDRVLMDKKTPAIVKVIAKAYSIATLSGDTSQIRDLLNYVLGKPTQGIELGGMAHGTPIQVESVASDIDYSKLPSKVLETIIAAQVKHQQ